MELLRVVVLCSALPPVGGVGLDVWGSQELNERDGMDGDPLALKAPLFQKQPRKRETDDRRRVLNLRDDKQSKAQGYSQDSNVQYLPAVPRT
jgi:hypothetical protein